MKKSILILVAVIAVVGATRVPDDLGRKIFAHLSELAAAQPELELTKNKVVEDVESVATNDEEVPPYEDISKLGWILNHEGKKAVRNVINTMPCGWPEYGIPPLAPYRREEMLLDIKKSVVESLSKLIRFRIDGLDNMVINKLKISYLLSQKVKFNFNFPRITISGKYITDTLVNLMQEYGISIRYEGNGDFEISLENLTLDGSFKYKMPFIFGSIKIYKFNAVMVLGNCVSHINGLMGNGRANNMINDEIEDTLMWAVNGNQETISLKIEETLVPTVNEQLKGHKIWSLLGGLGGSGDCIPPPDPWA